MLKDAAEEDLEVTKAAASAKNEVLFPVGLPDQGLFDWLDGYLEQNPHFVELSDRKVLDWARQSGIYKQRGQFVKHSFDKPGMDFGIPLLDDLNVQKTLSVVAPILKRDFVQMELKSNLIAAERKAALAKFPSSRFKKVAMVVMGEPPADFKAKVHEWMLADKIEKAKYESAREPKRRKTEVDPEPPQNQDEDQAQEKETEKEGESTDAPKEGEGEAKDGKEEGEETEAAKKEEPKQEEVEPVEDLSIEDLILRPEDEESENPKLPFVGGFILLGFP
jgi:hypothetical protein